MRRVIVIPASCPNCHSTKRTGKRGSRIIKFSTLQNIGGIDCMAKRISYVTCLECGQNYIISEPIKGNCSESEKND